MGGRVGAGGNGLVFESDFVPEVRQIASTEIDCHE